jgi:hypothetical protein
VGEDEDEVGEENEDVEVDEDEDVKVYRHVGYYQVSRVIFCNFLNNGLSNYFYTKLLYFIITYFYYAAIISNVSFHYTTSIVNKIKNINNISCSILYIAMYIRKYTYFVLNSNVYKNSVIFLLYRHWHSFYSYALFIYYSCIKF